MLELLDQTTDSQKETRQYQIFIDSEVRSAIEKYKRRYPGSTKKAIIHRAIEYYVSWQLFLLGQSPCEGWQRNGDKPVGVPLLKESQDAMRNGYYATVLIERSHTNEVDRLSALVDITPRQLIMQAQKSYLFDKGFLNA